MKCLLLPCPRKSSLKFININATREPFALMHFLFGWMPGNVSRTYCQKYCFQGQRRSGSGSREESPEPPDRGNCEFVLSRFYYIIWKVDLPYIHSSYFSKNNSLTRANATSDKLTPFCLAMVLYRNSHSGSTICLISPHRKTVPHLIKRTILEGPNYDPVFLNTSWAIHIFISSPCTKVKTVVADKIKCNTFCFNLSNLTNSAKKIHGLSSNF